MTADLPTHPSTEAERREVSDEKASGGTIEPGEQYRVGESGCVAAPSTEAVGEVRRRVEDWTTNVELEAAVAEVKRAQGVETMQAYQLAKLLPEHLRQPFWEDAVKYYLADALALEEAVERDGCWVPLAEATKLRSERDDWHTTALGLDRHITSQNDVIRRLAEERDQALADLSAMTSDRDWLRGELEKALAEATLPRTGPRTWEVPGAPEGVMVRSRIGEVWRRCADDNWETNWDATAEEAQYGRMEWAELVVNDGPLTEVVRDHPKED